MNPYAVIKRPRVSEKSTDLRDFKNQYTFEVAPRATKDDVKKAVKALWDIEPTAVRTMITRGKVKRKRSGYVKASNVKKAIVTLKEGTKIPLFEEQ